MPSKSSDLPKTVTVRGVPIELCQFLKFGGLASTGGEAKRAVGEGRVLVNGVVESRKRRKLLVGDKVALGGNTIVVATRRPSAVDSLRAVLSLLKCRRIPGTPSWTD
jgi:ribosome-associated protein